MLGARHELLHKQRFVLSARSADLVQGGRHHHLVKPVTHETSLQDLLGNTALHIGLESYREEAVKVLLEHSSSAVINLKNALGWNSLHSSCKYEVSVDLVSRIIDAGADMKKPDYRERSALQLAEWDDVHEMIQARMLREDPNFKTPPEASTSLEFFGSFYGKEMKDCPCYICLCLKAFTGLQAGDNSSVDPGYCLCPAHTRRLGKQFLWQDGVGWYTANCACRTCYMGKRYNMETKTCFLSPRLM